MPGGPDSASKSFMHFSSLQMCAQNSPNAQLHARDLGIQNTMRVKRRAREVIKSVWMHHTCKACRFFTFLLYLFLLHTLGISMFRFVAALCRDETIMAVVGSAFFLVLILLGGFLLSAGKPSSSSTQSTASYTSVRDRHT